MQLKSTKTRYSDNFAYYANDTIIGKMLEDYGEYQQREIDALVSILSSMPLQNRIIYDIGANIGYHTTAFAKNARHVYSWEASPQNYHLLRLNTQGKLFGNVSIFNKAIHNRETDAIKIEEFDPTVPGNYGATRVGKKGAAVEARFLDSYINEIVPPTLIKIDVEGAELEVLKGAEATLIHFRPVVYFEMMDVENLPGISELMQRCDYKMWWFKCPNFVVNNFKGNPGNAWGNSHIFSILAIHNSVQGTENLDNELDIVDGPNDDWRRFCDTWQEQGADDLADR